MAETDKGVAKVDGAAQAAAGNDRYEPINDWLWDQAPASWEEAGKMGEANRVGREAFESTKARLDK